MKIKMKRIVALLMCFTMLITLIPSFDVKTASAAVTEIDLHQTKLGHPLDSSWTMHDNPGNADRTKKAGSNMWQFRIGGKNAYCLDFGKHSFESGDPTYGDKGMFLQYWDYNATWGSSWEGNAPSGAAACTSKTRAMIAAAMFVEKNPSGCSLSKKQRRMFAQTAIWAIRCQVDWKSTDTISQHKKSVVTQLDNAKAKINGISTTYSSDELYDFMFKTDWSGYKVRIKFFKSCKYDSKGNVVDVPGYQRFMNIKIVPDEDFDWETVGASEGYHERVRVRKTDEDGKPIAGVKFRLTLTSDTDNVYDYRVSKADGTMADTEDVNGSEGMDANGNDYLIATTNSSGYAFFFIARNNSIDDSYGYITSPSDPSDKIISLAKEEMKDSEVTYYSSKANARAAAEKALAGARGNINDEGVISEEVSSLPDAYTSIAKSFTVYNRKAGGNGAVSSQYTKSDVNVGSAGSSSIKITWKQENVFFKDAKGNWVDESATSTGLGTKTHGNRNDISQVDLVDKSKKAKVKIVKKAVNTPDGKAHGDATLAGAQYQLYSDAACTKKATVYGDDKKAKTAGIYTTAEDGTITSDYIRCGITYYLKEIKAPEGFLLSNEVIKINLTGANISDAEEYANSPGASVIANETEISNYINIYKYISEGTGQAIFEHDVTFQVYLSAKESYDKCSDQERAIIKTDEHGFGKTQNLLYGQYTVHQIDTGLYDTEKVEDFPLKIEKDVTEQSQGYHTVMNNEKFKAYLKIYKVDSNTQETVLKEGTVFEIYKVDPETGEETQVIQSGSNGKKIITLKQFTTDEDGTIQTLQPLDSGTYRIREVETAPGLHQVKDYIEVEINSKNDNYTVETDPESKYPTITVTVDYENEETHGKLSIAKKGEQLKGYDPAAKQFTYEEAYLNGVTFEVYAKEDIVTQDNQGTNWYEKGDLVATVETGKGVQFSKECEGITGYEMDEAGVIIVDLPLGEYTVKEINTGYGYVLPENDWDVTFTWEDKEASYVVDSSDATGEEGTLNVFNTLAKANVSILKSDKNTQEPVAGAVFGLYATDDIYNAAGELIVAKDTLLDTVTTDGAGKAASSLGLPLMSKGYGQTDTSETKEHSEELSTEDQKQESDGDQKADQESGQDPDEETENQEETPGNEKEALNSGNYYFKELSVSGSYYLDPTPVSLHVEYADQNTPVIKAQAVKENDQTTVEIDKLTLAGSKELPGCKLLISDTEGHVIISWTSGDASSTRLLSTAAALGYRNLAASMTEKGNLMISGLLQDTEYVLTETKPADGYVTASDITFKIGAGENNQVYVKSGESFVKGSTGNRVMMYDDTTKVHFKKKASDTKKQLAGAEFEVYDSAGNQIYTFTTGKKAEKIVGVLAAGKTYTFKEVKAPKGYKKAKPVKIKVEDSGDIQELVVTDKAYGKISTNTPDDTTRSGGDLSPKTGYTVFAAVLSVLMFLSGSAVILLKRKKLS